MKRSFFLLLAILFLLTHWSNAQRPGSKQATRKVTIADTSLFTLPYIIDSALVFGTDLPPSVKQGSGEPGLLRKPLAREYLRWDDALYAQKVWRELDLREKMNQSFRYDAIENDASTLFIDILFRALRSGSVQAFRDERFSTPITTMQLNEKLNGKLDTIIRYDPTTLLPNAYIVTRTGPDVMSINKLLILEEWIFDNKGSRLHSRIIGLAPLQSRILPGAGQKEMHSIKFWIYYDDLRPCLANHLVYNPKNMGINRMTWEELFEARMFSSTITRSTIDNVSNKPLRFYTRDPLLALQEGEATKQRIFNYEQDLWSY